MWRDRKTFAATRKYRRTGAARFVDSEARDDGRDACESGGDEGEEEGDEGGTEDLGEELVSTIVEVIDMYFAERGLVLTENGITKKGSIQRGSGSAVQLVSAGSVLSQKVSSVSSGVPEVQNSVSLSEGSSKSSAGSGEVLPVSSASLEESVPAVYSSSQGFGEEESKVKRSGVKAKTRSVGSVVVVASADESKDSGLGADSALVEKSSRFLSGHIVPSTRVLKTLGVKRFKDDAMEIVEET